MSPKKRCHYCFLVGAQENILKKRNQKTPMLPSYRVAQTLLYFRKLQSVANFSCECVCVHCFSPLRVCLYQLKFAGIGKRTDFAYRNAKVKFMSLAVCSWCVFRWLVAPNGSGVLVRKLNHHVCVCVVSIDFHRLWAGPVLENGLNPIHFVVLH